jgi:hypothetical protein
VASVLIWTASKSWTSPDSAERSLVLGTLAVVLVDGIVEPTLRVPAFAWVVVAAGTGFPTTTGGQAARRDNVVVTRPSISSTAFS